MPSVKGTVALLAGATVHSFFALYLSHALPREAGVSAHLPPGPSLKFQSACLSNYSVQTVTLTTGWITSAAGPQQCVARLEREGRSAVVTNVPPHRSHVPLRYVRCRPKSRRRRKCAILPLYVAGVEGVGLPPATSTATTTTTTTLPVSVPQPTGGSTAGLGAVVPASQPPPSPPLLPDGATRKEPSAGTATNGDRRGRTNGPLGSTGSSTSSPTRTSIVFESSPSQRSTSSAAASGTTEGEVMIVDEGEAICRRLENVISREVEVGGEIVHLRLAKLDEYLAVADVRFSVFSPVHNTLKHRFRERSCALMGERRRRGAFCLVAVLERLVRTAAASEGGHADGESSSSTSGDGKEKQGEENDLREKRVEILERRHVLGTLECSKHEFEHTPLEEEGRVEGGAIPRLYLTEVAVRSDCRRLGIGRHLLGVVDDVARHLSTSEIFLHVNEVNEAAVNLYTRCGYEDAPDCASNHAFTNSLGLSGGFIGQRHRLLRKTYAVEAGGGDRGSGHSPSPSCVQ